MLRRAARSPVSLMVAGVIHRGEGGNVRGGRGGFKALREWNFVSTTLRSEAAGRERGNAHLNWR